MNVKKCVLLDHIPWGRPLWWSLFFINLVGSIYGFYWYKHQILASPYYLWPFIPNSPLAVFYFFLVLIFIYYNKRVYWLEGLAYFGLIRHGLWTVYIISMYVAFGMNFPENLVLWGGHLGMALQAVLFWSLFSLKIKPIQAVAISAWYLFNDFLDYFVGIYPSIQPTLNINQVRNVSFTLSVTLSIIMILTALLRSRQGE